MNERMIELANKAGAASIIDGMDGRFYSVSPEMEKFAELIVRECIQAVSDDGIKCDWYQHLIKQHFGVDL